LAGEQKTVQKPAFKNQAKPLNFSRRTDLAGILSFWSACYVLKFHVYPMGRIMPPEVGERSIGAGSITFLMA